MNLQQFQNEIPSKLHRLVCVMESSADRILKEHTEITFSTFLILLHVYHNQKINQKDISNILGVSEAAISRQVNSLKDLKMIEQIENKDNRKMKGLILSKDGMKNLNEGIKYLTEEFNEVFESLEEKERSIFAKTLDKLIFSMEKYQN